MDSDTVNAIAALARNADVAEITRKVELQGGGSFVYRNHPTEYGRELGNIIMPPPISMLSVSTLTGFCDAIKASGAYDPEEFFIHVEDYLTVSLKERTLDAWGQRATHVMARHTPFEVFKFDYYYPEPQRFIIALQVAFLQTEELLYLIRLASNIKAGSSVNAQDDGFSQTVTVKTGEITTAEVKIKPRVKLIPLRTFPEAAPVESEFLVRFQQNNSGAPGIALFDVDGKRWQGELMLSIKKWLSANVDGAFSIIA